MGMKQTDYTISDVLRLKPDWLRTKQTDGEKFNGILDRIANMMDYGFSHIAPYKFHDVFDGFDVSVLDQKEINKCITVYKEKLEEKNKTYFKGTMPGNAKSIIAASKSGQLAFDSGPIKSEMERKKRNIKELEHNCERHLREIRTHYNEIENYRTRVVNDQIQIDDMEKRIEESTGKLDVRKVELLRKIPNHWRITKISREFFTVIRVTPVMMTETNAASGSNRFLDMGHYGFSFNYSFGEVARFRIGNNIQVSGGSGAIHPHVNSYICWGNLSNQITTATKDNDSERFFRTLDSLLENYNSGSPFAPYERFNSGKKLRRMHIKKDTFLLNPGVYREMYQNSTDERFKKAIEDYTAAVKVGDRISDGWYTLPLDWESEEEREAEVEAARREDIIADGGDPDALNIPHSDDVPHRDTDEGTRYPVGTRVTMRHSSGYFNSSQTSGSNPSRVVGQIVEHRFSGYEVRWSEGNVNSYEIGDLIPVYNYGNEDIGYALIREESGYFSDFDGEELEIVEIDGDTITVEVEDESYELEAWELEPNW